MRNISELTITSAAEGLAKRDFSAVELADAYLSRIAERNGELNAYLEVYDDVKERAAAAQKHIDSGAASPLAGIPLALKDNMLLKGKRASAASKMLEGYVASYTSTAVRKLEEAGAVFLGRTNMDEFAMGSSTENSAFGVTRNPRDPGRVAGGSSGGSAAAVAADMAIASLGSDTGGSIRQPASLCGIVGLKPTYGRVSRHGLMALGSSLDQIGPFAKMVADAEIVFNAIKGIDVMDGTTISDNTYPVRSLRKRPVVGIPKGVMDLGGIDPDVKENFNASLKKLAGAGFDVEEVELPHMKYSLPVYYIIMPAEASSNLARYDGVKYALHRGGANLIEDYFLTRGEGFGRETRRRILLGTYVLSSGYYDAYYSRALAVQKLVKDDFAKAFEAVDLIATPTTPSPAFRVGEKTSDPIAMYLEDIFTVTANIAGVPAISLPSGTASRDGKDLPLGLQLHAAHGAENLLFEAGKRFLGEEA